MNIYVEKGAYAPNRAHKTDAGLDIRSRETRLVKAHSSALFHTGLHVQLLQGTAGLLVSKSGLNVNHGITSTGLIDEGYTGEILVKLYNNWMKTIWCMQEIKYHSWLLFQCFMVVFTSWIH